MQKNRIALLVFVYICIALLQACDKTEPSATDDSVTITDDDGSNSDDGGTPPDFTATVQFVNTYGGSDIDEAKHVAPTSDGGYVTAGFTKSTDGDITDKIANDEDVWVAKYTAQGTLQWNKTYGGTENDAANSIAQTADGGYIIAGTSRSDNGDVSENFGFYDFWILKLDSSGALQWEKSFGFPGSDQAFNVLQTSDGGYFASGFIDVTASNGQGNDDRDNSANPHGVGEYWAIRMDSDGDFIWRRYFGGTNNDRSYGALQASDGGFLLVGTSESTDFDISNSKGSYDLWAIRINASGAKLWERSFGGSLVDVGYSVTPTADGNYLFVADTRSSDQDVSDPKGNADAWLVKFSDSGNFLWEKTYGGTQFDSARDAVQLPDGKFLVVGGSRSTDGDLANNNGESDAWFFVTDADGELLYSKTLGGTQIDFLNSVAALSGTEIILAGNSESDDVDISENKGSKDLLLIKLKI